MTTEKELYAERLIAEKEKSNELRDFKMEVPIKRIHAVEARKRSTQESTVDFMIDWVYKAIHIACNRKRYYTVFFTDHEGHLLHERVEGKENLVRKSVLTYFRHQGYIMYTEDGTLLFYWGDNEEELETLVELSKTTPSVLSN